MFILFNFYCCNDGSEDFQLLYMLVVKTSSLFNVHFLPNFKPCENNVISMLLTIAFKHLVQVLAYSKYSINTC